MTNEVKPDLYCYETIPEEEEMEVEHEEILDLTLDELSLLEVEEETPQMEIMDVQSFWENFCEGAWLD